MVGQIKTRKKKKMKALFDVNVLHWPVIGVLLWCGLLLFAIFWAAIGDKRDKK